MTDIDRQQPVVSREQQRLQSLNNTRESTRQSLSVLEETRSIGRETMVELDKQSEHAEENGPFPR